MKRKILLMTILVVVIASASIGGVFFVASAAAPSQTTQKLVDITWEGLNIDTSGGYDYYYRYATDITITNPNCTGYITITDFVVIDETGNETSKSLHNMNKVLGPHEIWKVWLVEYVDNVFFEWPQEGPLYLTLPRYTVEISWSGRVDRPLNGLLTKISGYNVFPEGQGPEPNVLPVIADGSISDSQMVNYSR